MPTADVGSEMMDEMFNEADKNHDKFIDFDEFGSAGEAIDGDGNEMEEAAPMTEGSQEEAAEEKSEEKADETAEGKTEEKIDEAPAEEEAAAADSAEEEADSLFMKISRAHNALHRAKVQAERKHRANKHRFKNFVHASARRHEVQADRKLRANKHRLKSLVHASARRHHRQDPDRDAARAAAKAKQEKDKAEREAKLAAKNNGGGDNFQDEVVDQADVQFKRLSGGDDCIDMDDAHKPVDKQFDEEAVNAISDQEKEDLENFKQEMLAEVEHMWNDANTDNNECVDKAEFKAAMEMEADPSEEMQPPKGSGKDAAKAEAEWQRHREEENQKEFEAMDTSNDGQVSRSEAYDYAETRMPQADISQEKLDEMFDKADTNDDNFISQEEFNGAGKEYEGDGPGKFLLKKVVPLKHHVTRKSLRWQDMHRPRRMMFTIVDLANPGQINLRK
jgi:Ca2+-binding EF-hand superfamily protein